MKTIKLRKINENGRLTEIKIKGVEYQVYFSLYENWNYRTENKINGKTLKTPVYECVVQNGLFFASSYEENGIGHSDLQLNEKIKNLNLEYSEKNILKVINLISDTKFNNIEII